MLMREDQRLIEKGADERDQDGECLITWGKCGPSGAPAEPFLPSLGCQVARFCFSSTLGHSHFYVFVCCFSMLSLHWAVPQISFVFCFLSSCGLCSWLFQLPLILFFVSETSNLFFCHYAIPSYLSSLYLWKLRSSLNIFNFDNKLESTQRWIYLQKLVAWADLPGKVGRD